MKSGDLHHHALSARATPWVCGLHLNTTGPEHQQEVLAENHIGPQLNPITSQLPHLYARHSPAPELINKPREVILSQEIRMSLEIQRCSVLCLHGSRAHCYSLARNRAWIEPGSHLQLRVSAKAEGVERGAGTETKMLLVVP